MSKESVGKEIRKNIENKKIIIGTKSTMKNLKLGKVEKVYVTNNCPEEDRKKIELYSKLSKVKIEMIGYSNEELGVICKKSYPISVASLIKETV